MDASSLRWFDTLRSPDESRRMAEHIERIPRARSSLPSSGTRAPRISHRTRSARSRRSERGQTCRGRFRAAHAVIGVKGAAPGGAVEDGGTELATAAVGRTRPLALILEAFELR